MEFIKISPLISSQLAFLKKELPKFSNSFNTESRRLNLILISLFFLIFPNQNAYQSLQPLSDKPLVRQIDFQLTPPQILPSNKTGKTAPSLTAKAALVIDLSTKTVLFAKDPNLKLLPASTTKLMTALVAADYFQPNDVLTVKNEWKIGQVVGLKKDERLTFESLLYSLLVGSGNDAAYVLTENYPGGMAAFMAAMNEKKENLHLKDTFFVNVAGIDAFNHHTTVHDLAILAAEVLKSPLIAKIVATPKVEITNLEGNHTYLLESTNKLLGQMPGIRGIKTGWTENAGECLVTYVQREQGEIITVLMGSTNRFGETKQLINWVYQNFIWEIIPATHQ